MSAIRKYIARRPMIANAFEANTMNCSWLTASTAGTLSTANTTSVASTSSSTENSGVASRLAVLHREQLLAVELVGARHDPLGDLEEPALARVDVVVVAEHQLAGGVEQERAEDVEHPVEALDDRHAGEDERRPQDQRPEDAPEQHAVLVLRRHEEVAQDQRPDEHVVDAEALLDQVARDVLAGRRAPRTTPRSRA